MTSLAQRSYHFFLSSRHPFTLHAPLCFPSLLPLFATPLCKVFYVVILRVLPHFVTCPTLLFWPFTVFQTHWTIYCISKILFHFWCAGATSWRIWRLSLRPLRPAHPDLIFNRRCVQLRPDATAFPTHVQAPSPPLLPLISRPDAPFSLSFFSNVLTPPSFPATSGCSRDVESLSRERRSPTLIRRSDVALPSFAGAT